MSIPVSVTVQSLVAALLAKSGLRSQFHLMIEVAMGKFEQAQATATDYLLLLDRSGSMGDPLGTGTKFDTLMAACENVVNGLNPDDRVGILAFDTQTQVVLNMTDCDFKGKAQAINAIYGMRLGGSTAFGQALEAAFATMGTESSRKRAILFFTDGEDGGSNPRPIAQKIKNAGIALYAGGLGVRNIGEQLLDELAGTNFRSLADAADVTAFFAGAQAQAQAAVITNAQLRITPVTFAKVTNFELVARQGKPNYAPGTGNMVNLGDIAEGDLYQSYLGLQVVLPEDIRSGRRSFGKIELVGDVVSQGLKGQVLASAPIAVMFGDQPVASVNETVKNMINTAATARELYQYAQTGDASHVAAARKTAAFSGDAVAAALKAQLADIEAKVASNPDAAQKQARRATKGFSAEDAAAALKNMGRN